MTRHRETTHGALHEPVVIANISEAIHAGYMDRHASLAMTTLAHVQLSFRLLFKQSALGLSRRGEGLVARNLGDHGVVVPGGG